MHEPIFIVPAGRGRRSFIGSFELLAQHEHVHNDRGECLKNRYYTKCSDPTSPGSVIITQEPVKSPVFRTKRSRTILSWVAMWVLFGGLMGTLQGLTGGGWWGYFIWAGLLLLALTFGALRAAFDIWVERGE